MTYELFTKGETPDDGWRTPQDAIAIFEYSITYIDDGGVKTKQDTIVGYSDSHAREEAFYECSSQIISVERGQFLYWQ